MSKQSSQYDKIFKENLEAIIPGLLEHVLGITVIASEELPDDIQHTKERKPDMLKKITDAENQTSVLQIEFQVADEPEMVYRMAEYYIMLEPKVSSASKAYVLYLGTATPTMPTRLDRENLTFTFPLIIFASLDYQLFLRSDRPEEILLGILANFDGNNTDIALRQIVRRIEETSRGDLSLRKHINQLRVLAQLRNLGVKLKSAMDSIAQYISPEKDAFYLMGEEKGEQRGEQRGKERAEERIIRGLLTQSVLSAEQIAESAGVSIEFVEEIRAKISAN